MRLLGCWQGVNSAQGGRHAASAPLSLRGATVPGLVCACVTLAASLGTPPAFAQWSNAIPSAELELELAVPGASRAPAGRVDVEMTSSGLIIVLRQADDVYVVDHEGSIVGHIGDDSRADGVRAPVAMGIGSGDTLYVVDPAERNVQVYTVTEDGLKYVRSMPSNAGYFDVCVTGDRVYALAPGSPRLIHELERDGSVLRSFGELDPNGSETTAETRVDIPLMVRTDGWLSCSRAHDLVVFVGRMTGRVHAYSLDGDLRWRVDLTEFSAPRLREGRCCSFLPNRDSGSIEEVKAVVIDSDSGELLVSSYDGPMHQPGQHKVRLIRITDGKHVAAHTGPLVVLGLTTNGYYGLSFDEGLRVLQFTYRDGT